MLYRNGANNIWEHSLIDLSSNHQKNKKKPVSKYSLFYNLITYINYINLLIKITFLNFKNILFERNCFYLKIHLIIFLY